MRHDSSLSLSDAKMTCNRNLLSNSQDLITVTRRNNNLMNNTAEKGDKGVQNRIDKGSPLDSLDPQLRNGLLTVGGRLRNASIPENAKHQLILPKNSPVSVLLIKHVHQKAGHQCRNHVLVELKRKYWIIQAGVGVRSLVNRCVVCRKYQAKASKQKMADLPAYRLQADNPPFTISDKIWTSIQEEIRCGFVKPSSTHCSCRFSGYKLVYQCTQTLLS